MHNWDKELNFDKFKTAVTNNKSIASVIRELGLFVGGANYKMVKSKVKQFNLDTSHWLGQGHSKGTTHLNAAKRTLDEILVENSTYSSTSTLKKRLIKEGLLDNVCFYGHSNNWMNQPLTLHMDHINGICDDNRIENLRLLCPNCHSQTNTYAGKNKQKAR